MNAQGSEPQGVEVLCGVCGYEMSVVSGYRGAVVKGRSFDMRPLVVAVYQCWNCKNEVQVQL